MSKKRNFLLAAIFNLMTAACFGAVGLFSQLGGTGFRFGFGMIGLLFLIVGISNIIHHYKSEK